MLVQPANVETGADELGRNLKGARAGFWILKRPGVGRDRGVKILGNVAVEREALIFDQFENNFSRGRRGGIDINEVAVAWIAQMMIDVDPGFRRTNGRERGSKPILDSRVQRDGNINIFRRFGRLG